MYQASTVLTGSEMPALNSMGACAIVICHPRSRKLKNAATRLAARFLVCISISCIGKSPAVTPIGSARDAPDLIERAAPAGRSQHLAAEMLGVAGDAVGLVQLVRLCHHHLFAAERLGGFRLRRCAGRDLDAELGLEIQYHLLGIGGAP